MSSIEESARKLGLPVAKDYNDPAAPAQGIFRLDTAISRRGERVSAFTSFLNKDIALQRRGWLTVCTGAIASRLELDAGTGLVSGVRIRHSEASAAAAGTDREFGVQAAREVIVCSGALCAPQLLLLSGLGPRRGPGAPDLGIPLARELPAVGATFADHFAFPVMLELPRRETLHALQSVWVLWWILQWLLFGTGLIGCTTTVRALFARTAAVDGETMAVGAREGGGDGGADTLDASRPRNVPDVEIMVIPINSLERLPGRSLISLFTTLVQPRGSGRVELATADPRAHPRVTHPALRDAADVATARRAVRLTLRLADEFRASGYPGPVAVAVAPGHDPALLEEWERTGELANPNPAAHPTKPVALSSTGAQSFAVPAGAGKTEPEVEAKPRPKPSALAGSG